MVLTTEQFKACFPGNGRAAEWMEALAAVLPRYEITTPERIAAFLAQCGHESNDFTAIRENLNYSAAALFKTWPKRFPPKVAEAYARQPEKIGNRAYADRLGNGPEESGDGFFFRGGGLIQITGKDNYYTFGHVTGRGTLGAVEYIKTLAGAVESACWYWQTRGLNVFADQRDMLTLTKRINGGTLGLADRMALYNRICRVLAA